MNEVIFELLIGIKNYVIESTISGAINLAYFVYGLIVGVIIGLCWRKVRRILAKRK